MRKQDFRVGMYLSYMPQGNHPNAEKRDGILIEIRKGGGKYLKLNFFDNRYPRNEWVSPNKVYTFGYPFEPKW